MGRVSFAALAVALFACDKGADPNAPRDYSDAEIAGFEQRLMTRLTANQQRHCVRPVLSGEPRPGSALKAQLALVEPTGEVKTCQDKAAKARHAHPVKDPVYLAPSLHAVDDECGELLETHVRDAIAHEDACTPYLTGVRVATDEIGGTFNAVMTTGSVLAVRAWRQEPSRALPLVAAGLRWNHDLSRGPTTLLNAMVAFATRWLVDVGIEKAALASPEDVTAVAALIDTLIATYPRFGQIMQGEHEFTALYMGLAALKPVGWVPPGGASRSWPRPEWTRNEAAQMLDHAEQQLVFSARYCSERASLATCYTNYLAHGAELPLGFVHAWNTYVQEVAQTLSHLIALRIALEVRAQGRCPTTEELESARYRKLRHAAVLGDLVRTSLADNALTIRAPLWAVSTDKKEITWSVACP